MKKFSALFASVLLCSCGYADPNAGQVSVLVHKPWFFGHGGVSPEPVTTGTQLIAWSTSEVRVPTTPIAFDISFDNMMPQDGIPLDFHTVVRMQIVDAPALVRDWNGGALDDKGEPANSWFWANISPVYSNLVRQEVKRFDMASLAFGGEAIDSIDASVSSKLNAFIKKSGMPVKLLSVTVGRATPPQEILNQRTETAAQQQRQKTMDAMKNAEDSRKAAEMARAAADNAYRSEMSLSPEQFVDLERIKMQRDACQKNTCIFGNASPVIGR